MSFVSLQFPFFFIVVTMLFFVLPHRARTMWLVLASCWFYMAFIPSYILILFILIAIDYGAGLAMERSRDPRRRRWILVGSLAANLLLLCTFKYLNFILGSVSSLGADLGLGAIAWRFPLVLPIGLSFHTFQSMAYTIEVYRGHRKAERHLGTYALYVLFYPQMVAGPIERPQSLLHQLHEEKRFDPDRIGSGLGLMVWGFAKKLIVADRLATYVDAVYRDPQSAGGWAVVVATVFFSFQIYCDFSGYTDIARGAARVMGYKLMVNFNFPYCSRSPAEFWRRWHISLSTWFRDYLYLPLGGSRQGRATTTRNIMIVFLLSGLWHGANWTFVAWGALHGAYLVAQVGLGARFGRRPWWQRASHAAPVHALLNVLTFVLVTFAWIFFRAPDLRTALAAAAAFLTPGPGVQLGALFQVPDVRLGFFLIAVLEMLQWLHRRTPMTARLRRVPTFLRWVLWCGLIVCILLFGKFGNEQFLYCQF